MKGVGDYKKQSVMSEVFKDMIKRDLKDWEMVFAVSVNDDEKKDFENFKKSCDGFPIRFLINKNNNELWDIYSRAKIYWHATGFGEDLSSHPELAEHFGISTVEAMGAGVVPVVINAGGQKETVRDNIDGFLWDTKQDLREKTLKLVKDEKLWLKMAESSAKRAEHFARDRFCRELSSIINI
jgi:glycosyltransferase involved in cell wall biosynthesis